MTLARVKIGQLGKIITGKTPPTAKKEYYNGDFPFITPTDIFAFDIKHLKSTERSLSDLWQKKASKYLLPKNSICYVCIGSTVGKLTMNEKPSFTNQQINSIVCNSKIINENYFYYKLRIETPKIRSVANSRGAGKPIINKTGFENIEIDIIQDIKQQEKIAEVLSNYDSLIENNNRQIEILEELAQVIYKEKFLNNSNYKWETKGILDNDLFKLCKSKIKKYDGQKEYFDTSSIDGIKIIKNGEYFDYNKKPSRAQIQPVINSVWFARMKNTYKVLVYNDLNKVEADNSMLSSGMVGFSINNKYLGYLFFTINSQWFHEHKDQYATGATQVSLTNEGLAKIKLKIPDIKSVEEYAKLTNPMVNEIILLLKKNKNLMTTRDLLLPKLMSGEIEL